MMSSRVQSAAYIGRLTISNSKRWTHRRNNARQADQINVCLLEMLNGILGDCKYRSPNIYECIFVSRIYKSKEIWSVEVYEK